MSFEENPAGWQFTQWFRKTGSQELLEKDEDFAITALELSRDGDFIATGDYSGNIVVLRNNEVEAKSRQNVTHFEHYCEFAAHMHDFDFAIRKPIQPQITGMAWGPSVNESQILLASNTHRVRVFKIRAREFLKYTGFNDLQTAPAPVTHTAPNGKRIKLPPLQLSPAGGPPSHLMNKKISLKVPKVGSRERAVFADLKSETFKGAHVGFISQLSTSRDDETFLSADAFRINQWQIERPGDCQSLVDFSPTDVQEIILSLDHHPEKGNLFLYGTSKGKLNLCDTRAKSMAGAPSRVFDGLRKPPKVLYAERTDEEQVLFEEASMFDEVTSGVTGMQISGGGRFIITRDYMSVKIWDMNYEKKPIETIYVQEFLRPRLMDLHEHHRTWQDSFKVAVSPQGNIATGTYSNYFHIIDLADKTNVFVQAATRPEICVSVDKMTKKTKAFFWNNFDEDISVPAPEKKRNVFARIFHRETKPKAAESSIVKPDGYPLNLPFQRIDFNRKASHICWHPKKDSIAVASANNLYVYTK